MATDEYITANQGLFLEVAALLDAGATKAAGERSTGDNTAAAGKRRDETDREADTERQRERERQPPPASSPLSLPQIAETAAGFVRPRGGWGHEGVGSKRGLGSEMRVLVIETRLTRGPTDRASSPVPSFKGEGEGGVQAPARANPRAACSCVCADVLSGKIVKPADGFVNMHSSVLGLAIIVERRIALEVVVLVATCLWLTPC